MVNNANILYEPSSTREDCGVLVITASQPVAIPFIFEIPVQIGESTEYSDPISETDSVVFVFKSNKKLITPDLRKTYTNTKDNIVILELDYKDLKMIYGNKLYCLGVYQYDSAGNIKNVLIRNLPVRVEGVVQDVYGI